MAVVALSGGCKSTKPRTQVMLVVDADPEVQMQTTSLRVEIEGRPLGTEMYSPTSDTTYPPPDSDMMMWPYSIALVPRGGELNREFRITATAYSGTDAIARLRAESGFVSGKTIELKLHFQKSCLHGASLDCMVTETCVDGYCVPSRIDQTTLPTFTDEPPVIIPVGDGGPTGTTSNPNLMAGAGGASGNGMAVGMGGTGGAAGGDPSMPGNCGDGKITGDEKCDTAIPDGMAGACPKACTNASACDKSQLEGTGCQTRCTPFKVTELDSGDGCCPEGADANSDTDCRSSCGNGTIEAGEACDPVEMCPTAVTCLSANMCLKAVVVGDPAACTSQCTMQPIDSCMPGDGCCPAGCTNATDSDCSASCGNGTIEAGEACEPNSAEKPCPTSCDDGNSCTTDLLTGSPDNCNSACTNVAITAPKNDDGCCPSGANANNDNDCNPICGNRIVEAGERCDGRCPTVATCADLFACTRDGITGSGCSVQCTHEVILTPARGDGCCPVGANQTNDNDCEPVCGNLVIENGETCDGNCPTNCDDGKACTADAMVGSGCARSCTNTPLGPNANTKDGCCPGTGMTSETDADCPDPAPRCGDGKKNGDEVCDPPQAACPACTDNDECTNDVMGAGQDACHPTCSHPSKNGMADGVCCPKGATMTTDPDCPAPAAMCGNDKVEGDEECDGNCGPVNDGVACTEDASLGPCKKPTHTLITTAKDGDGCCPGLDQYQDSDCPPQCGNNMKEASEECDGSAPPPATCSETCKLVEPPAAICGDGQVNRPNEECDALVLPTDTCSENCKIIEPPPVSGTSGGTSGTGAIP